MPSMSTSHGGVLYYVVKIPKRQNSPDRTSCGLFLDENAITSTPVSAFQQKNIDAADSGWDNPFRPDGDLSKEADEIVELIKEGKPITPTQANNPSQLIETNGTTKVSVQPNFSGNNVNGDNKIVSGVEVQHGTIATPTDASTVEHVVIKKKKKFQCCVIQ